MFYAQVTGQWAPQKLDSFFFWCLSKTDAAGSIVASVSLIVVRLPVSSPVPDELNQLARDYHMQGTVFNCGEIDCLSLFLMNHLADYPGL